MSRNQTRTRIYLWTNDAKLRKTWRHLAAQSKIQVKPFALELAVCKSYPQLRLRHSVSKYTYVQLQFTYILTCMEFTTLIIMVGHLDPDIPLTNVQVSVTRIMLWRVFWFRVFMFHDVGPNCGIRHVTVPIATRILIANVRHIGLSNICVINLVYFKMQVWCLWNRYKATVMLNCSQYGASRLK